MRSIIIAVVFVVSLASAQAGENPREFVRRFYAAHQTWSIRGVPMTKDEGIVSQFVGIEIVQAFHEKVRQIQIETCFAFLA
jgi:hypothetical protein